MQRLGEFLFGKKKKKRSDNFHCRRRCDNCGRRTCSLGGEHDTHICTFCARNN